MAKAHRNIPRYAFERQQVPSRQRITASQPHPVDNDLDNRPRQSPRELRRRDTDETSGRTGGYRDRLRIGLHVNLRLGLTFSLPYFLVTYYSRDSPSSRVQSASIQPFFPSLFLHTPSPTLDSVVAAIIHKGPFQAQFSSSSFSSSSFCFIVSRLRVGPSKSRRQGVSTPSFKVSFKVSPTRPTSTLRHPSLPRTPARVCRQVCVCAPSFCAQVLPQVVQ